MTPPRLAREPPQGDLRASISTSTHQNYEPEVRSSNLFGPTIFLHCRVIHIAFTWQFGDWNRTPPAADGGRKSSQVGGGALVFWVSFRANLFGVSQQFCSARAPGRRSRARRALNHALSSRYRCAMPDGGGLSPPSPKFPRWPHVPTDDCALLQCDGSA